MSSGLRETGDPSRFLSDQVDQVVRELAAGLEAETTVLAVGGYGRGQLWLHSDIDLLILHEGPAPETKALLYPLWDARLKVGHATRTARATLAFARDDLNATCSLLTARLVTGSPDMFRQLQDGLVRLLIGPRANLAEHLAAEQHKVWEQEPFARQELDVKTGRGGLRTFHRLDWDRTRALLLGEEAKVPEQPGEVAAVATLSRLRHAIHALSRRPSDLYPIDLRPALGRWLNQEGLDVATEVYRAARKIDSIAALRFGRLRSGAHDPINDAGEAVVRLVRARWTRRTPTATPFAQAREAALGRSRGRLSLWERDFASRTGPPEWSAGDRAALLALLAQGQSGWEAIAGLWEAGWLTRALPELSHLHCLSQAAPFHAHTVDAHLGATVSELVLLAESREWSETIDSLGGMDEVLLAGFLHDVGKGRGGDHSLIGAEIAASLLRRIGFEASTAELVSKACRLHLLLNETAQRRDLSDPAVVSEVAAQVEDLDFLHLLNLLSIADARATGPEMWSPWKQALLQDLVDRVAQRISGTSWDLSREQVEALHRLLEGEIQQQAIDLHLASMPTGYLARFGPDAVADHLRLLRTDLSAGEVRSVLIPGAPVSNLVIVTRDRPGLLAIVAGVLAVHNLNVLEAGVATRNDGLAIDSFRVVDSRGSDMVGQGRWPAVRESLEKALAGRLNVEERLREKRTATNLDLYVEVDGSRLEIEANDRPGLLHDLASALNRLGLEIDLAKIDTRGGRAIDVFTLRNSVALDASEIVAAIESR